MIRILLVCALAQLAGCASIVTGHNQPLTVDTPGCNPAVCKLSNDKGTWYVTTPGSVTVRRAYGNLQVECTKEGYAPASTSVASSTKAMAYGNVLVGGLIGVGVDAATGAAYDYPEVISIPLSCGPDAKVAQSSPAAAAVTAVKEAPAPQPEPAKPASTP